MKISSFLNKIVRPIISTHLSLLVMVQIMCIAGASFAQAQNATSWKDVFENFSIPERKTIQTNLNSLGYYTFTIDGLYGPYTDAALNQFGRVFIEPTISADVLAKWLSNYADINEKVAAVHPTWQEMLFSEGVDSWIERKPERQRSVDNEIRRSGTAQQVIDLLNAYIRDRQPAYEFGVSFKLTEDDLNKFTSKNKIIKQFIKQLQTLKNKTFDSEEELVNAVKTIIEGVSGQENRYGSSILESAKQMTTKEMTPSEPAEQMTPSEPAKEMTPSEPAEQITPSEPAKKTTTYKLTDEFFEMLNDEYIPDNILNELTELKDQEYVFHSLFDAALQNVAPSLTKKQRLIIAEQAKKSHKFDSSKQINWSGGSLFNSCGCVRNFSDKVVYGFYPFWMADGTKQKLDLQKLDFSVLSRIGYFAVPFDSRGQISKRLHLTPEYAKFMKEAWRYGTNVDLIVYQSNWPDGSKKEMYDELITNIDRLLKTGVDKNIFDWIKYYLSFGGYTLPTIGDGVTLFFDEFSDDSSLFTEFIKDLKEKLNEKKKYLNLMLPMNAIGKGIYNWDNLQEMAEAEIDKSDNPINPINLFLVFLPAEPTKQKKTKKEELRQRIEDNYDSSKTQKAILRKIVPVISPSNVLDDDLVYFEDNFAGVGFWPLPDSKSVNKKVRDIFEVKSQGFRRKLLPKSWYNWVHNIVCPNKWWFRIIFNIWAAILLVYGLLSIWFFKLRSLFERYIRYFLVAIIAFIIITAILYVWDGRFKPFGRGEVLPLVGLVLIILGVARWRYKKKQTTFP